MNSISSKWKHFNKKKTKENCRLKQTNVFMSICVRLRNTLGLDFLCYEGYRVFS